MVLIVAPSSGFGRQANDGLLGSQRAQALYPSSFYVGNPGQARLPEDRDCCQSLLLRKSHVGATAQSHFDTVLEGERDGHGSDLVHLDEHIGQIESPDQERTAAVRRRGAARGDGIVALAAAVAESDVLGVGQTGFAALFLPSADMTFPRLQARLPEEAEDRTTLY